MKRLPRLLLGAATLASLVLCAVTVALWVRSYTWRDSIAHIHSRRAGDGVENDQWRLVSEAGRLGVVRREVRPTPGSMLEGYLMGRADDTAGRPYVRMEAQPISPPGWLNHPAASGWGPVRWAADTRPMVVDRATSFGVAHWAVVGLLAIAPAVSAWSAHRARRRLRRGDRCAACGYDLQATPDRCPECGTPAAPPATTETRNTTVPTTVDAAAPEYSLEQPTPAPPAPPRESEDRLLARLKRRRRLSAWNVAIAWLLTAAAVAFAAAHPDELDPLQVPAALASVFVCLYAVASTLAHGALIVPALRQHQKPSRPNSPAATSPS